MKFRLKIQRFLSKNHHHRNEDEYDNRILFLTDASPTVGPGDLHITQLGQKMADTNPRLIYRSSDFIELEFLLRILELESVLIPKL